MKKLITILALTLSASIFANNIPNELKQLVPVGSDSVRIEGKTASGKYCITDISFDSLGFSISNIIPNENGTVVVKSIATLQIGLGHKLETFKSEEGKILVTSLMNADEGYSSDTKSTALISRNNEGEITKVTVSKSEKRFFGYKKKSQVTCNF